MEVVTVADRPECVGRVNNPESVAHKVTKQPEYVTTTRDWNCSCQPTAAGLANPSNLHAQQGAADLHQTLRNTLGKMD